MLEDIDASRRGLMQTLGTAGILTVSGLVAPAMAQEQERKARGHDENKVEVTPPEVELLRNPTVYPRVVRCCGLGGRRG